MMSLYDQHFCFIHNGVVAVYANYIGPSVMTDANCEGFPICDDRITENDRCVIKIIGIHCSWRQPSGDKILNFNKNPWTYVSGVGEKFLSTLYSDNTSHIVYP